MAKKKKKERDEILEDIESSLSGVQTLEKVAVGGCLITIHPNGLVEISAGMMANRLSKLNNSDPCCCYCG